TAVALSGTALGLQITSTVLYSKIAKKAGAPETANGGLNISPGDVGKKKAEYEEADNKAQAAETAYEAALEGYEDLQDKTETTRAALENALPDDQKAEVLKMLDGNVPADFDPENPPPDLVVGVMSLIDEWFNSEARAEQMGGIKLVDKGGN